MYDYQKDKEQLSSGNNIGTFQGGENTSSNFKLKRESLPQWAVDWAKDRFNMDAKSVKFYVMDEQEPDDSVAFANGDSVFVTSDQRNDEEVIKHELTHIYQQAIGTATESNASDVSLEEEAVQVSEEGETSLAKTQVQGNGYILPKEKTNAVQSFGMLAIAGLSALGGMISGALIGNVFFWVTMMIIARRSGAPLKTVRKVCNIFRWARCIFKNTFAIRKLCEVVHEKNIQSSQLEYDSVVLKGMCEARMLQKASSEYVWYYAIMLRNGFKGFKEDENLSKYFNIHTEAFLEGQGKPIKVKRKRYNFDEDFGITNRSNKITIQPENNSALLSIESYGDPSLEKNVVFDVKRVDTYSESMKFMVYENFHRLTYGFQARKIEDIQKDVKILFGYDLEHVTMNQSDKYIKIYNKSKSFTERSVGDIYNDIRLLFGCNLVNISMNQLGMYEGLYNISCAFKKRNIREIQEDIKIFFDCDLLHISKRQFEQYFGLCVGSDQFAQKTPQEIKDSIEIASGCSFLDVSNRIDTDYLMRKMGWFKKITPQKFKKIIDILAAFLNIKKDNKEIYLALFDELLCKVDYFNDFNYVYKIIYRIEKIIEKNLRITNGAGAILFSTCRIKQSKESGNWLKGDLNGLFDILFDKGVFSLMVAFDY